eukprot:scaffold17120_cov41-Phaeocystis_antarctica.AAC.4
MRGAHVEHAAHVRDAGRVEAQRLVERRRDLPSRKEGRTMRGEVWAGGGRAWAGVAAHERHAREEGPAVKAGGGYRSCAERTENIHCMAVTLDVSKLSGWLNFDAACRVERRAHDAERGVDREAGKRGLAAAHERHARSEGPGCEGWGG